MKNLIKNLLKFIAIIIIFGLSPLGLVLVLLKYGFNEIATASKIKKKEKIFDDKKINVFREVYILFSFKSLNIFFERLKEKIKDDTKLDLFDWCNLSLFILGLFAVWFFYGIYPKEFSIGGLMTAVILWFTAIAIMQYTKETYFLKDVTRKALDYERAPFVIFSCEPDTHKCYLKNVGRGVARDVFVDPILLHGAFLQGSLKDFGVSDIAAHTLSLEVPQKTVIEPGGRHTYFDFKIIATGALQSVENHPQVSRLLRFGDTSKPYGEGIEEKERKAKDSRNKLKSFIWERFICSKKTILKINYKNSSGKKYFTKIEFNAFNDANEIKDYGEQK